MRKDTPPRQTVKVLACPPGAVRDRHLCQMMSVLADQGSVHGTRVPRGGSGVEMMGRGVESPQRRRRRQQQQGEGEEEERCRQQQQEVARVGSVKARQRPLRSPLLRPRTTRLPSPRPACR